MMDRVGPLELAAGRGIAVGDTTGVHILLTREEVLWCEPGQEHDAVEWDELSTMEWIVPTRRIALVGLADAVVATASVALDAVGVGALDAAVVRMRARTLSGEEVEWTATPHHVLGYPARVTRVVAPFLEQLRTSPAMRAQLATDPRATLAELRRQIG